VIKVLHIISGLNSGGAERNLFNLVRSSQGKYFNNCIVSLRDEGIYGSLIKKLGIKVICLKMGTITPFISGIIKLIKIFIEWQPDLVHGWMYHGNLIATMIRVTNRKIPIVWSVHNALYDINIEKPLTKFVIWLNKITSIFINSVIYVGETSKKQHEVYGFNIRIGQVISNGFDFEEWKPDPEARIEVRNQLGIPKNALVLGHFARYDPVKDHQTYLSAIIDVASEIFNVHFLLAGKGIEYGNNILVPLFSQLPNKRLHVLGEREDIQRLMSAIDVFCLSSWSESLPNTLIEAMACRVPCVSTNVGESANIVGDTGKIIPIRDPHSLAKAIIKLLIMPADDRAALGFAARERVNNFYNLDVMVKKYESLYAYLISLNRNN
jgi:glycosyltransferase involved in cell wall biosynthesis